MSVLLLDMTGALTSCDILLDKDAPGLLDVDEIALEEPSFGERDWLY